MESIDVFVFDNFGNEGMLCKCIGIYFTFDIYKQQSERVDHKVKLMFKIGNR